jgi:hypothetical protein
MDIRLQPGERAILESSAKYLDSEGTLVFTDKRIFFYVIIKEYMQKPEYGLVFESSIENIISATHRGTGFSILELEMDTTTFKGPPHMKKYRVETPKQSGSKGAGKLCLNCMSVVPDYLRACPKCGEPV